MTDLNTRIRVGLIVNTRGVRGELIVKPLTDDPRRFERLNRVFIENFKPAGSNVLSDSNFLECEIEYVRFHKEKLLLKFKEFSDINAVAFLKGKYITIDEKDCITLPEDSYFIFDLLGCEVYDLSGNLLGAVIDVLETGGNDVYVLAAAGNEGVQLLVPAVKSVIKSVSINDKKIVADFVPADT